MKARFQEIRSLLGEGRYLEAFDLADRQRRPSDPVLRTDLQYLRALALARSGAGQRALDELGELDETVGGLPLPLVEDVGGLRARLVKDDAIALGGEERRERFAEAAELYESVFRRCGGSYSCINAATCHLLAGDEDRARALARAAARIAEGDGSRAGASFWSLATRAEAALILGDTEAVPRLLTEAVGVADVGAGQRASTRRQLRVLAEHLGADSASLLRPIANPDVIHFCGAMNVDESAARAAVAEWWGDRRIGDAFGSLARGADLVVAEAALARGARLHLVLPFAEPEFLDVSVGDELRDRFERCRAAAASVTIASDSAWMGHDGLFAYASDIAMGRAIARGRELDAAVEQLAIWDGVATGLRAGTARDVEVWRRAGRTTHVLPVAPTAHRSASATEGRAVRAIIFGDFAGFSRLSDQHYPAFVEHVMRVVAQELDAHAASIRYRNTWGDGIVLVMDDVARAAELAVGVQTALSEVDLASVGLPESLRLRLSAHAGPVFDVVDPITGADTVMGRELTRGARIEPQTPTGQVYASEAFAALLELAPVSQVRAEYVGRITTAKGFETVPVYVLRSAPTKLQEARDG